MLLPGAISLWSIKGVIAHIMCCEDKLVGSERRGLTDDEGKAIVVFCHHTRQKRSDEDLNDARRFCDLPADWFPWQMIDGNSFQHDQKHMPPLHAWLAQQDCVICLPDMCFSFAG
jgi:hypothetical protein